MRARYEQVVTRRGATAKHVAKVAAARELLDCVFYALRDGRIRRLGHTGAHDTRADHPGGYAALLCLGASPRPFT